MKIPKDITIEEIDETIRALNALRAEKQREAMNTLKETMRNMAAKSGLTVDEIFGRSLRGGKAKKVAAKWRNPDNPAETWTGRGRRPKAWSEKWERISA